MSNVEIIDDANHPKDIVGLGSWVTLREKGTKIDEVYHIVGESEADPTEGKISYKSPLGVALMGHKVKEKVTVDAPDGELIFVIRSIQ